jgi:hypothetical protein
MNKYIIRHDDLGILSNYAKFEWYGNFNDEGGYFNNAQLFDEQEAQEIENRIIGAYRNKVREVTVIMDAFEESVKKKDFPIAHIRERPIGEEDEFGFKGG